MPSISGEPTVHRPRPPSAQSRGRTHPARRTPTGGLCADTPLTLVRIISAGLVPIIEPEVDIHAPDKARAEQFLKAAISNRLDSLTERQFVMLKLTSPETDDLYRDFVEHPNVLRVLVPGIRP